MTDADDDQREAENREALRELAAMWDLAGQRMEDMAALGQRMASRNLRLWNSVSRRLETGEYTTDDLTVDAKRVIVTAMNSWADMWSTMTSPPERQNVAGPVPTAFLFFDRRDDRAHELIAPTLIRLQTGEDEQLPQQAKIVLSGADSRTVQILQNSLVARLHPEQRGVYVLETVARETMDLEGGAYDGFMYLNDPGRPLATIRIVVEKEHVTPDVDAGGDPSPQAT